MTLLAIYVIGAVLISVVATDGPPYASRDALLALAVVAVLWPLVLAVGLPLWMYLRITNERTK